MNVLIPFAMFFLVVLVMFLIAYSESRRELPRKRAERLELPRKQTEERLDQTKAA